VERGRRPGEGDRLGVRFEHAAPDSLELLARETPLGPDRTVRTDVFHAFAATRSVPYPHGYLLDPSLAAVADLARLHGIAVRRLDAPTTAAVEACRLLRLDRAAEEFQGHRTLLAEVEPVVATVEVPAGSFHVSTAQSLGDLACYLLDPESDDGVLAWNFLDEHLARLEPGRADAWLPIHRVRGGLGASATAGAPAGRRDPRELPQVLSSPRIESGRYMGSTPFLLVPAQGGAGGRAGRFLTV
jgi:hypothetical protein